MLKTILLSPTGSALGNLLLTSLKLFHSAFLATEYQVSKASSASLYFLQYAKSVFLVITFIYDLSKLNKCCQKDNIFMCTPFNCFIASFFSISSSRLNPFFSFLSFLFFSTSPICPTFGSSYPSYNFNQIFGLYDFL